MSLPLLNLSRYDVSEKYGFVQDEFPLDNLPEYYSEWDFIAHNLPSLVMSKKIRCVVDSMATLDTKHLETENQWRRACSILGFMAHAYVWCPPEPCNRLPENLVAPWRAVSAHFDLPMVVSYAGTVIWNFTTVLPQNSPLYTEPTNDWLDSIRTQTTFTGCIDESWFYLVSVAIEIEGAPMIKLGLDALEAVSRNDASAVIRKLQDMAEQIDNLTGLLARMYEWCDPHIFYNRFRPFLGGWKNMDAVGLPDGVYYGNDPEPKKYAGGSNAQSSLIQYLDIILNVHHYATGERVPPGISEHPPKQKHGSAHPNFINEMRDYMPKKHREFLYDLERIANIRDYVVENATNTELVTAYDACLAMLRAMRTKHIQVVTRYIVMAGNNSANNKPLADITSEAKPTAGANRTGLASKSATVGTGGTNLLPFLKQVRDEVSDSSVSSWGRRILSVVQSPQREGDNQAPSKKQS